MHQPVEPSTNGIEFRPRHTVIAPSNMNLRIGTVSMPRRDAAEGSIILAASKSKVGIPVMLWPTLLDAEGKIEDFQLVSFPEGVKTISPKESLPSNAVNAMLEIANAEKLHGFAAEGSLRSGNGVVRPSHEIVVDGNKGTVQTLHGKELDSALASVVVTDEGKGESKLFLLNVAEVGEDGKIAASVLQTRGDSESGWVTAPEGSLAPRALEELTRFAEKHQHFGHANAGYVTKLDEKAKSILADTDIDAGLAKLLSAHHEKCLDEALDKGDLEAAKSASDQSRSHREAVAKLSKPKNHLERLQFERDQQVKMAENGDIERFSR